MTIPGKRTLTELARALIPARVHLVSAGLAVLVCIGMTIAAAVLHQIGPQWLADETQRVATIFRVMPVWMLIGGVLGQFSTRLNAAIDDVRSYWGQNEHQL